MQDNKYVCIDCLRKLPRTYYETCRDNPVEQKFYGRVELFSAFSGYYFEDDGDVQRLIHAFKYHNRPDVAVLMGTHLGRMMLKSKFHLDYDYVIPVPLHPEKLRKRGYNQTEMIARGISEITGLQVLTDVLVRVKYGISQTNKSSSDRWLTIQDNYECINQERLIGARVLIVDDVLTTGATLEVCCKAMKNIPGIRLGIVTVGVAS